MVVHSGAGRPALHFISVPQVWLACGKYACRAELRLSKAGVHVELHLLKAHVHAGVSTVSFELKCMQG